MLWLVLAEVSMKGMPWLRASCSPLSLSTALFASQSHLLPISSRSTSEEACWRERKGERKVIKLKVASPSTYAAGHTRIHLANLPCSYKLTISMFCSHFVMLSNDFWLVISYTRIMPCEKGRANTLTRQLTHNTVHFTCHISNEDNDHTHMIWWPHPLLSHDLMATPSTVIWLVAGLPWLPDSMR